MTETPLTFQDSEHNTVAAILAEPENTTGQAVILCHGFLSNKDSRTNLCLTELLIVHGERDELVPFHQIERLQEALPDDAQLVLLPEADHQFGRPQDFRRMTVHLADWMQTHLPTINRL